MISKVDEEQKSEKKNEPKSESKCVPKCVPKSEPKSKPKSEPKNDSTIKPKIKKKTEQKVDKNIGTTVGGKYKIKKVLGKGSFGVCYEGIDTSNGDKVAVKLEANNSKDARRLMKQEIDRYKDLKDVEGIPKLYYCGKDNDKYLVVIQLLGYDLEKLLQKCSNKFSLKTIFMLAEQMIIRLKAIHERDLVHRDLKPENFLIGVNDDEKNMIFIIDFGLTKSYIDKQTKKHVSNKGGHSLTGTVRYCSINAHLGHDMSRRDDLESVAYILIYFFLGSLPWDGWQSNIEDKLYVEVKDKKISLLTDNECSDLPSILGDFLKYCRQLEYEEEPDYSYWQQMFVKQQFQLHLNWDYKYDWIKD